jgi:hypothetical protein
MILSTLYHTLTTIIQEQPHGATASARSIPLPEEQEDETQGTDVGTSSRTETPLAEPIEKQPSTVPMMTMPTQFDEINLKQVIISHLSLTYYRNIIFNLIHLCRLKILQTIASCLIKLEISWRRKKSHQES